MRQSPIDADYLLRQLEALLRIDSPTSFTDTAVRYCSRELERLGLAPGLTRRGAVRAVSQGGRRQGARAIVSHIDTLGAQVRAIKDNGRLELVPIGHWPGRFAEGARVNLYATSNRILRGTILPLKASGHTFNEECETQPAGWRHLELRIDAVTTSAAETQALGVEIGDIAAIDPAPEFCRQTGFINSRHLDDKAGVAIMLAAIEAFERLSARAPVDIHWLFTVAEEVGVGAASVILPEIASLLAVDNGTSAPGQNSSEFGVTLAMADQSGPFDYHLTRKLAQLCRENDIPFQKDVFRYYRSDSASAIEAGHDIRTALVTFGIDASHGWERIHRDALVSVAELLFHYITSPLEIARDVEELADVRSFTHQPARITPVNEPEETGQADR